MPSCAFACSALRGATRMAFATRCAEKPRGQNPRAQPMPTKRRQRSASGRGCRWGGRCQGEDGELLGLGLHEVFRRRGGISRGSAPMV